MAKLHGSSILERHHLEYSKTLMAEEVCKAYVYYMVKRLWTPDRHIHVMCLIIQVQDLAASLVLQGPLLDGGPLARSVQDTVVLQLHPSIFIYQTL